MLSKIIGGPPYCGQIVFKALRDTRDKTFTRDKAEAVYDNMLRGGDHDLIHFHSRLKEYLPLAEHECSTRILKHACVEAFDETLFFDMHLSNFYSYELFQSVLDRLTYEGYIVRDPDDQGKIRFVSPLLRDWWAYKMGVSNVRL